MAPEIFRFTVIRPVQKKDQKKPENFTLPRTRSPINRENSIAQGCGNIEPLWEEELYIVIGKIKRFHLARY